MICMEEITNWKGYASKFWPGNHDDILSGPLTVLDMLTLYYFYAAGLSVKDFRIEKKVFVNHSVDTEILTD